MGNKQITLTPKSVIDFTIYFEPTINENDNSSQFEEVDIEKLSNENIDKMKNYYNSKYFKYIFDKLLKNDILKYKIINTTYDNLLFKIDGEVSLKKQNEQLNISYEDIDSYIKNTVESNINDFKLKISENYTECDIELEISDIEYELKERINLNKHVKIIKPRRRNELYEKEKIINKDFKFRR